MPLSSIKEKYLNKRVAFGKTAAPLYKRDDIDDLAIMAWESKSPSLIKLFEVLPDLDVLKKARANAAIKKDVTVVEDHSKEDPNKELKEQRPDIEQNNEDPNKDLKEQKDVGPFGTDTN
jgi:hypothetical protein